jgi:hypothetical protein
MAELILEDIPDDDSLVLEDVPEKIKPKPETIKVAQNTSDPFKQGLAGITDAISGVPALAGIIKLLKAQILINRFLLIMIKQQLMDLIKRYRKLVLVCVGLLMKD